MESTLAAGNFNSNQKFIIKLQWLNSDVFSKSEDFEGCLVFSVTGCKKVTFWQLLVFFVAVSVQSGSVQSQEEER